MYDASHMGHARSVRGPGLECHVGWEGSGVSHGEGGVWCDTWGGRGLV